MEDEEVGYLNLQQLEYLCSHDSAVLYPISIDRIGFIPSSLKRSPLNRLMRTRREFFEKVISYHTGRKFTISYTKTRVEPELDFILNIPDAFVDELDSEKFLLRILYDYACGIIEATPNIRRISKDEFEIFEAEEQAGEEVETASAEEFELPLSNLEFDNTGYCNITFPGFGTKASMSTAAKVIYLWVLMHPDGVLLSQRFDAQEEFYDIYIRITGKKKSLDKIENTIAALCDPENDNRFNIELSRCNGVIRRAVPMNYYDQYCIKGSRGKPYRVKINRCYVRFPDKIKAFFEKKTLILPL